MKLRSNTHGCELTMFSIEVTKCMNLGETVITFKNCDGISRVAFMLQFPIYMR